MRTWISILLCAFLMGSCKNKDNQNEPYSLMDKDDWIVLFDGTTTEGWRGYNMDSLPSQWIIEDRTLTFDAAKKTSNKEHQGGKDIIYGAEEFDNFELYIEWKIPPGGNSGIFYHVKEGYGGPPDVAPEYQLIDDENYSKMHDLTAYNTSLGYTENPQDLQPLQQTACDYAMTPADPSKKSLNPAGEWNTSKIVFTPQRAEHWLNGQQVLTFEPWSEDWMNKKDHGKWKATEDYGKFKTGYIGLQDHDSPIWFRNIKIKKL